MNAPTPSPQNSRLSPSLLPSIPLALSLLLSLPPSQSSAQSRPKESDSASLSPTDSHAQFIPAAGLAVDLIAAEPVVQQPSFLRFDERGRLWVVQYRQYPMPAGLEIESRDNFWRNRYDRSPPPPGHPGHVPGADRITIHEDSNGDGEFDSVKTFADGLSLATGLAWDKDGVWVLQPPYLLFYPNADGDDIPDAAPEIHLSGFGIEDSHSIANSLAWGPDGWLYGAQGSTVTASIEVAGNDAPPIKSVGQLMWRFHPKKRIYEVFAEGGGNIWSCQFDSLGRLYAGANEGGKLGYHYMQGSYSRKNFRKHGELSNPYAFDYFNGIEEPESQRVTTNLMIYEEQALPDRYFGSIITANPLASRLFASKPVPQGPTFHSDPIDILLDSNDRWFRPVYTETGPDGAIYVADWYDFQVNHMENSEGRISLKDGRIQRVRPSGAYQTPRIDLGKASSEELLAYLKDDRRWYRNTARRLINERQDVSIVSTLDAWLANETGQTALEALWALNLLDAFSGATRENALNHANPHVRKWAVRLIGDNRDPSDSELARMQALAASDPNVEVRQQLASSAKRLQSPGGLAIVRNLALRDENVDDRYMPSLVWWALESHLGSDPSAVVDLFKDPKLRNSATARHSLLRLTMRRLAAEGSRQSLKECARLLLLAGSDATKEPLLRGFEDAFRGRSMTGLPADLLDAMSQAGGGSLAMQLRQGGPEAVVQAQAALTNPNYDPAELQRIIETLGEAPQPKLLGTLLEEIENYDESAQDSVLAALRAYNDPRVGIRITQLYPKFNDMLRSSSEALLLSRSEWTRRWLDAIRKGAIDKSLVSAAALTRLRLEESPEIKNALASIWGASNSISEASREQIAAVRAILANPSAEPDRYKGKDLYDQRCASCHSLHDEGGSIGPELTGYQRNDLQSLLLAIVTPNAEIREGFENYVVKTKDGQTIAGFISDQDEHVVVLRPIAGQPAIIDQANIESMTTAGVSLMPPGLLAQLDNQAIVDLFAYIQSTQPLFKRR